MSEILSRVVENQKAQIFIYKGITYHLEKEVTLLENKVRIYKKDPFFARIWKGIKLIGLGFLAGVAIML